MTTENKKKVAVLMGGWSAEREVSLVSGKAVCAALEELGHTVLAIDLSRDILGLVQTLTGQTGEKPDIIFNALHGRVGEDGTLQGLLDLIGIPYTHSGVLASSIAMDKPLMKAVVSQAGVRCAESRVVTHKEIMSKGFPLPAPFVIKPTNEGSSVGVHIVKKGSNLGEIEGANWTFGETVMIEAYVPGHELTVAVLGTETGPKALAVTELRPRTQEFYDYKAKYSDGQTDHLIPAPLPQDVYNEAMRLAEVSYKAVGCQGAARADFRWDDTKEGTTGLVFLEMNTQPGLTPLSLLPEQAKHCGMTFPTLIQWMLDHPVCPV